LKTRLMVGFLNIR